MHSFSKFIKSLLNEKQDLAEFCKDPIAYLDGHGYQTSDLPRRVGPLRAEEAATIVTVADLRRLLENNRLEETPTGGATDEAARSEAAAGSAKAEPTQAAGAAGPSARILAAPPVIYADTAAEPMESMAARPRTEASPAVIGLPFTEFAAAFRARATIQDAGRNRSAESARLVTPPKPGLEPLPDAGQSGLVALRQIIGSLPGTGTAESVAAEAIMMADDRVQVSDTFANPYRWLCRLEITASTGSKWLGTGWFVAPGVIVTAGHCVFIHNHGGWVQSIAVHVGQNRAAVVRSVMATQFATTRGWAENRDATHDYGVIFAEAGDQGYFGYGVLGDEVIAGALGNVTGYPQDKPGGTLWGHTKQLRPPLPQTLQYEIDTFGGMSGAPVVMWDGRDYVAIGIHNYGDKTANSARRITEEVFYNLERWKLLASAG